jgi:hypothetical protein
MCSVVGAGDTLTQQLVVRALPFVRKLEWWHFPEEVPCIDKTKMSESEPEMMDVGIAASTDAIIHEHRHLAKKLVAEMKRLHDRVLHQQHVANKIASA